MEHFINDYLDIILFAVIAIVLLWRLHSVLGARSEGDLPSLNTNPLSQQKDNVVLKEVKGAVQFPEKITDKQQNLKPVKNWTQNLPDFNLVASATVHSKLLQLPAFDPEFRPDDFMDKARKSFVLVVQAYATGNKSTLEMLLSPTLYHHFAEQIDFREQQKETYFTQLHGLQKATISDVEIETSVAHLTVDFIAEQSITHKDADGHYIDARDGRRVVTKDRWVFKRDLKSSSPFWLLDVTLQHAE